MTRPRRSSTGSFAAPARAGWRASRRPGGWRPTRQITLVRPLLAVSRGEIRDYLAELGQPYREDQSNTDLTRTRARIRHDLLPKLAGEYNPKVAEALVRLGSLTASFQTRHRGRPAQARARVSHHQYACMLLCSSTPT